MEGEVTLWELAERATEEVRKWPRWKRNAADLALTTPKEDRERPKGAETGSQRGLAGGLAPEQGHRAKTSRIPA